MSLKILIGELAEFFDQTNLLRVIRTVVRAVKIVKPFGKIHVCIPSVFVSKPGSLPRLIGLVFSCHKSPIIATDLLKIKKREKGKHVIAAATSQPFGVDDRSPFLFKPFDKLDMFGVFIVTMIRNYVRMIQRISL